MEIEVLVIEAYGYFLPRKWTCDYTSLICDYYENKKCNLKHYTLTDMFPRLEKS